MAHTGDLEMRDDAQLAIKQPWRDANGTNGDTQCILYTDGTQGELMLSLGTKPSN